MAETLVGGHFQVTCADCGFPFRCDAELPPAAGQAVCPNCGYAGNLLLSERVRRGQRVLIDRWPLTFRSPRRWELLAFRDAQDRLSVKRLVALPHEQVSIRGGELYVNGRLQRKSLRGFREMAVLVHDSRYEAVRTGPLPPTRWQADRTPSGWSVGTEGFQFVPPGTQTPDAATSLDWLTYQNWRCYASPLARTDPCPITDHYGYSQGLSHEVRDVTDVMVTFQLKILGNSRFAVRINDERGETLHIDLDPSGHTVTVLCGKTRLASAPSPAISTHRLLCMEVGYFDQRVAVAANGRLLVHVACWPADGPYRSSTHPVSLGAGGCPVRVREVKVFRDIYYRDTNGLGRIWDLGQPLGTGEFLLLGDNPPASLDSRHWKKPGLAGKRIVGRVLPFGW